MNEAVTPTGEALAPARFDVVLGNLRILLPAASPCEYLAQAVVYPVPRAPRRLFGMMHLRGHPLPVFDVHSIATDLLPIVQRCRLVVLREGLESVGLICDRPPSPVTLAGVLADAAKPDSIFRPALNEAWRVQGEDGEGIAWSVDLVSLIDLAVANGTPEVS